jgi:hypothetical protein
MNSIVAFVIVTAIVLGSMGFGVVAVRRSKMTPWEMVVGNGSFATILLCVLFAGAVLTSFTFLGAAGWAYSRGGASLLYSCLCPRIIDRAVPAGTNDMAPGAGIQFPDERGFFRFGLSKPLTRLARRNLWSLFSDLMSYRSTYRYSDPVGNCRIWFGTGRRHWGYRSIFGKKQARHGGASRSIFHRISLYPIEGRTALLNRAKQQRKGNMEKLALALLALRSLYKQQETLHSEAEEFRPFDLQQLRHLSSSKDKSASRLSDRNIQTSNIQNMKVYV